tara:strand:- start:938 stop:1054 length:117 start_codon:yes stop_codon:yes gene_type:complete
MKIRDKISTTEKVHRLAFAFRLYRFDLEEAPEGLSSLS